MPRNINYDSFFAKTAKLLHSSQFLQSKLSDSNLNNKDQAIRSPKNTASISQMTK